MQLPQTRDSARHARCADANGTGPRHDVACGIKVHVSRGARWRAFTVIEEVGLPVHEYSGEPAASKIPCFRIGNGQSEGYGDGGVDGVSPSRENFGCRVGAITVWRSNRSEHAATSRLFMGQLSTVP